MYNRYVPQPDGTFRHSRMPDHTPPAPKPDPQRNPEPQSPPDVPCPPPPAPPSSEPQSRPRRKPRPQPPCREKQNDGGVLSFLRQLLPRDFDTGDLLVVLLLLLMSGDCQEDQNTALLTLVLYLFL